MTRVAEPTGIRATEMWPRFRLAGRTIAFNCQVAALSPFALPEELGPAHVPPPPPVRVNDLERHVEGILGGELRSMAVRHRADGTWVEVEGGLTLWIAADGSAVGLVTSPVEPHASIVVESLLGPGAILALAQQGVFCLHASAVTLEHGAVAFIGASGSGKSTLARLLGSLGPPWQQVGDDVLPIELDAGEPGVRPHFPQLKMAQAEQAAMLAGVAERLELRLIYLLDTPTESPPSLGPEVSTAPLMPREAALALVEYTVASRLFASDLVARHLAFCTAVSSAVPVRRLSYPRRWDTGPELAATVVSDLVAGQ